ncbi:HAMP domain-containing protein, partial [Amycolatopsis rhizosphaerae]
MTRWLLLSYLTITVLVLTVLILPLGLGFANHEGDVLLADIQRDAYDVASMVEDNLETGTKPAIDPLLAHYAASGGRIVVVDGHARAVADSDSPAGSPRDFSAQPEIQAALRGERVQGVHWSDTLRRNLMYVALPVSSGGVVHGVVRISYPTTELDRRVRTYWLELALLSAGLLAGVAAVGFLLARWVTRPVRSLQEAARQLGQGRLGTRVATGPAPPELRSLGETMNLMAGRLQRLMDSQRLFLADAAHQLRSPLTALRLRLETLEPALPPGQRPKLDAAVAETARLGRLVESLLVLARAEVATSEPEPVDAAGVARDRVEAWGDAAAEERVELELDAAPCPAALAVPGSLEQILDNLVSNAITASPPGGVVRLRVGPDGPRAVLVRVIDQGPGLSEQE